MNKVEINRVWAMPNRWTFTIKPIYQLIQKYVGDGSDWCDPFSGMKSPAEFRNDLHAGRNANYNMDALEFLKMMGSGRFAGVLYDPPYSFSQAAECYNGAGKEKLVSTVTNMGYWAKCKKEIRRIVKPGGYVISCGWNTNGVNNGLKMIEVLIVHHGGGKNDTLVTVEQSPLKIKSLFQ